jgi:hypothetical protein
LKRKVEFCYGTNLLTGEPVNISRKELHSPHGFILGASSSCEAAVKSEIENVLLNTKDDVVIIQTQANKYNGLLAGQKEKRIPKEINPMSLLPIGCDDSSDTLSQKIQFVVALCSTLLGGDNELTPFQTSMIDKCIRTIYEPNVDDVNDTDEPFVNLSPDMAEFCSSFKSLAEELEECAVSVVSERMKQGLRELNEATENHNRIFTKEFARELCVANTDRMTIYDVSKCDSDELLPALVICIELAWQRIRESSQGRKSTWVYLENAEMLFKNEDLSNFLYGIWRKARVYGAVLTGISSCPDMENREFRLLLSSSSPFLLLFPLPEKERDTLSFLLNIPPSLLPYISPSSSGNGLIYDSRSWGFVPIRGEKGKKRKK